MIKFKKRLCEWYAAETGSLVAKQIAVEILHKKIMI